MKAKRMQRLQFSQRELDGESSLSKKFTIRQGSLAAGILLQRRSQFCGLKGLDDLAVVSRQNGCKGSNVRGAEIFR
jgi:hypothetical protein